VTLSLYLVAPAWGEDPNNAQESVVGTLRNGPHYLDVARELWRLAGNEDRAAEIEALLERAYDRDNRDLNPTEIAELDRLLGGLEEALKQTVMDSNSVVPLERLPELRLLARVIDLEDRPQHRAIDGVSEGNSQVYLLREFLRQAMDRGLHLALD
jgi:hypothetical protein